MQQRIMKFVGGSFLLLAVVGITYVAGFRAKSPLMLNTVRRCLRATRPLALKSSGTPGAYCRPPAAWDHLPVSCASGMGPPERQ